MSDEPRVVRGYRALLRLYPAALRRDHGEEMVEVVRRRWARVRDASRLRRAAFCLKAWGDAVVQAGAAWLDRGRRRAAGRDGRRDGRLAAAAPGELLGDLRVAGRSLLRSPGFAGVAVLTLALGIGASTAIFSIVQTVLLEPLPFPAPERLVTVTEAERAWTWTPTEIVLDLHASAPDLGEVAGLYPRRLTVTGDDATEEVQGAEATANLFRVLGAEIARGRDFAADDARPGATPTAILAPGLRDRRYGAGADVVGRTIRIGGTPHRIVGVLAEDPPRLTPRSGEPELWIPTELRPTAADGTFRWTQPVIRLAPGQELSRARSALEVVVERFRTRHAELEGWPQAERRLTPLKSTLVRDVRPALLMLQLAVGALLLLACVNVANLLLVRTGARQQELAVRAAMGASRGRLLRHLLSESLLLAVAGGAAGLGLLALGLDLLTALAPPEVPRLDAVAVDGPVLLFTLAVSLGTGLLFGVVPALAVVRRGPSGILRAGGRTVTTSKGKHHLSQAMVVAQVTLTLVLLVGAGLMGRSFLSLTARAPGFDARNVLAVPLRVSESRYDTVPELEAFYVRVRARVAAIPGVDAAGVGNYLPNRQGTASRAYEVEGRPTDRERSAQYGVVSPGYFRVLDIPLLQGRAFRESDHRGEPRVAVVNRSMARRLWPDRDPVGRRIRFQGDEAWMTVVGVVGDVRGDGLAREPAPGFYVSYRQRPLDPVELTVGRSAVLFVRSAAGADGLVPALREAVQEVEPGQPVPEITPLAAVLAGSVAPERFRAVLLGAFAVIALVLVVAGTYGVVAHLVGERTREFGIRVAVGATRGDIVGRVLRWGLRLTAVGLVLGLAGVLTLSRYLGDLLFQVSPTDPVTVVGAAVVVVGATLAACLVPARRAVSVDPVDALRPEGPAGAAP